jgi:hypothetical protein
MDSDNVISNYECLSSVLDIRNYLLLLSLKQIS